MTTLTVVSPGREVVSFMAWKVFLGVQAEVSATEVAELDAGKRDKLLDDTNVLVAHVNEGESTERVWKFGARRASRRRFFCAHVRAGHPLFLGFSQF